MSTTFRRDKKDAGNDRANWLALAREILVAPVRIKINMKLQPPPQWYPLFSHMMDTYEMTLTDSELHEIALKAMETMNVIEQNRTADVDLKNKTVLDALIAAEKYIAGVNPDCPKGADDDRDELLEKIARAMEPA